ncbi:MAG: CPBP family intramembrane metalloprotease [Oscillospiraceae bacterium]|jgi:membrane protease YdiL (CAAX protease family)|nr:CPBP family intramembrane metalloprotease [Oscillospiraceae bacterium]
MSSESYNGSPEIYAVNSGSDPGPDNNFTFIVGQGFLPKKPEEEERRSLRRRSYILGIATLVFLTVGFFLREGSFFQDKFIEFLSRFKNYAIYIYLYPYIVCLLSYALLFVLYSVFTRMSIRSLVNFSNNVRSKPDIKLLLPACIVMLAFFIMSDYFKKIFVSTSKLFGVALISGSRVARFDPQASPFTFVFRFLLPCLLPAFFEEFFFRGAVIQSFADFGHGFAIVLSSLFAAIFRMDLARMPGNFMLGLVLGYFAVYSDNIIVPLAMRLFAEFGSGIIINSYQNIPIINDLRANSTVWAVIKLIVFIAAYLAFFYIIKSQKELFKPLATKSIIRPGEKLSLVFSSPFVLISLFILFSGMLANSLPGTVKS